MYKKNQGRTILVWENECFSCFCFCVGDIEEDLRANFPLIRSDFLSKALSPRTANHKHKTNRTKIERKNRKTEK